MSGPAIDSSWTNLVWGLVALLLDATRALGAGQSLGLAILLGVVLIGCARWLQVHQRTTLAADPTARVRLVRADLARSLPVLPLWPVVLLARALRALQRRRAATHEATLQGEPDTDQGAIEETSGATNEETALESETGTDEALDSPAPAYLAVSLGPTYLVSGAVVVGLYWLGRLVEPFLALGLDAPPRLRAWQVTLLGHRPELAWHLPLDERPAQAALLCFVVYTAAWGLIGRLVRIAWADRLAVDQWRRRDDKSLLPSWRRAYGVRDLVALAPADAAWTTALLAASGALLAFGWLGLDDSAFGPRPSALAATSVLWLGWTVHRLLTGGQREVEEPAPSEPPAPAEPGWPDVLAELAARHGCTEPTPLETPRPLPPSPAHPLAVSSPLLAELTQDLEALTELQAVELRRLATIQQSAATESMRAESTAAESTAADSTAADSTADETLRLPPIDTASDPRAQDRRRQRIVLAPEGAGKTLFALLAACQTTLLTARASLLVARDAARARELHARLRRRVGSSTARWSVRIRSLTASVADSAADGLHGNGLDGGNLGQDSLFGDIARGITPDILIVDLHSLVTHLLGDLRAAAPLLRRIGLVVLDDAESYRGPVEIHARLAFRRLRGQLRRLQEIDHLGEDDDPLFVLLATDSMLRTEAWLRELVGIEAGTASYDPPTPIDDEHARGGLQLHYRLDSFQHRDGAALGVDELIAACERRGVAWHARAAGDGRRHLGLRGRLETREPRHHVDAEDAAVVLVEGSWSAVRREIERLRHAGCRHLIRYAAANPSDGEADAPRMALISLVDRDQTQAFDGLDEPAPLARLLRDTPRPVLRSPGAGRSVDAHLGCDLSQGFTEVGDLLARYGEGAATTLRTLATSQLLSTQSREQISTGDGRASQQLFVRVLGRAIGASRDRRDDAHLPPPPAQVELTAGRRVELVDRDTGASLGRVEAATALLVMYPGRLVERRQGRFVVASTSDVAADRSSDSVVSLEPTLSAAVSSPRRHLRLVERPDAPAMSLQLGERPLQIRRSMVRVLVEHHGSVRLDARDGTLRQRVDLPAPSVSPPFVTEALILSLTGLAGDDDGNTASPDNSRDAARLLAAAVRLVLPVLLRGGDDDVAVGLDGPDGGCDQLVLLDLQEYGNGCARALERDGLEALLRLARTVLERIVDPQRLLTRYDHWPAEPLTNDPGRVDSLRRQALIWLDAHLRPEDGVAGPPRETRDRTPKEPE
ncbi:MAG: hypothetical protein AAGC60_03695 [Acidobacteriota bacterium]